MKNFIKSFGVFFLLLFLFTGCLKDDDRKPIYYFYDEPAVVIQMGDNPLIRNESYVFHVPELAGDTVLKAGNLLWTSFIVDLDNDVNYGEDILETYYHTATQFRYQTVDSAKAVIPTDSIAFQSFLSDDYSAPIELSVLYPYAIDSLWFFGFKQNDRSTNYTYELILNPTIEKNSNSYPTLYIRAKQTNASSANSGKARSQDGNVFAFDVADFVKYYNDLNISTNQVRFNLKYKTGVDANGNDIYRSFRSNPISWVFSAVRPE